MQSDTIFLENEAATERFGQMLAWSTSSRPVDEKRHNGTDALSTLGGRIYLNGELGAGKTTLARGLMRGYGYQGAVKSPTYTLVEPYEFPLFNIYHFDLYRLSDPREVEFLGVSEYFETENLCLFEWPLNGKSAIPEPDLNIELCIQGQGRQLSWQAKTPRGQIIAERLVKFCRNL
ncbi:MAG: tRNA (adenosine(37)-N6)-threonylcarbamoyltransferase complex ATPase subunit type 1 TsaE [Gammaproteobacteria bacterium]|nr:tRNA (adenosine(37)-N6)-threonylcarbamoyltransferase complex ATPase subunit type 1 TsaE [Gammaproteobacteria bacterium]